MQSFKRNIYKSFGPRSTGKRSCKSTRCQSWLLHKSCKAENPPCLVKFASYFSSSTNLPRASSTVHAPTNTMDPNYVHEEEEAAAMAAMMGFSGFGSQKPPAKRRKFTTDAFVEGQDVTVLDRGGKKGQGSGGNMMPLGKTRVFCTTQATQANEASQSVAMNNSEIAFNDDEEEAEGLQYVDTSLPPPIQEGPQYVDTSLPPPILGTDEPPAISEEEAKEVQSRIDVSQAPHYSNEANDN